MTATAILLIGAIWLVFFIGFTGFFRLPCYQEASRDTPALRRKHAR
jgi:hypothetical protein